MTHYLITETTPDHVQALQQSLRANDRYEITCLGLSPRKALWRSYRGSFIRKSALIDGQVAACWGLGGECLGDTGNPWLLTSPLIEEIPISFVREARREVGEMLNVFPRLHGYVVASYSQACGFLRLLGFELGDPLELGPNRELFYSYRMER